MTRSFIPVLLAACLLSAVLLSATPLQAAFDEPIGPQREAPSPPKKVVFHPIMKRVLMIVEASGTVSVWDVGAYGTPAHRLTIATNAVDAVFTAEGTAIITAGWDGKIREWTPEGEMRWESTEKNKHRQSAQTLDAGRELIVSGGAEGDVRVWNREGRLHAAQIAAHDGAVVAVDFAPGSGTIASAGADGKLRLWNAAGEPLTEEAITAHEEGVLSAAFAPNARVLMTAGTDGFVRRWRKNGEARGEVLEARDWVRSLTFSTSGILAAGADDGTIYLLQSGRPWSRPKKGHVGWVISVDFSADDELLASVGADGTVRLWELDGTLRHDSLKGHTDWVLGVDFSDDGTQLVSVGADGKAILWDRSGEMVVALENHDGWVNDVEFAPRRSLFVTAGDDGKVRLWDSFERALTKEIDAHEDEVNTASFSPDGESIVSVGDDGTVRFWNLEGDPVGEAQAQEAMVAAVAYTPDGSAVASGGVNGAVHWWPSDGSRGWESFPVGEGPVTDVAFTSDDRLLAVVDGVVRLFFFETGMPIGDGPIAAAQWGGLNSVAVAPDDSFFVAGGQGNLLLQRFDGRPHAGPVAIDSRVSIEAVAIGRLGRRVAAGASDRLVRVWNLNHLHEGEILWPVQGVKASYW